MNTGHFVILVNGSIQLIIQSQIALTIWNNATYDYDDDARTVLSSESLPVFDGLMISVSLVDMEHNNRIERNSWVVSIAGASYCFGI